MSSQITLLPLIDVKHETGINSKGRRKMEISQAFGTKGMHFTPQCGYVITL